MNYNKPKIRISINKKFMEDNFSSSAISNASVEEDFSWVKKEDKDNLKTLYLQYPFKKWKKILKIDYLDKYSDDGTTYQENVAKIFQEDIFKDEEVIIEKNNNKIFQKHIVPDYKIESNYDIHPDFIIKNIKKEKFNEILDKNRYMFRTGKSFIIPEVINYVTVIGESKISFNSIKSKKKQKSNYILFRDYINRIQKNVYFVIIYVFDQSYESFLNKNFIDNNDIIICYIPKLFSKKHPEVSDELIKDNNYEENNTINNNNVINTNKMNNTNDNTTINIINDESNNNIINNKNNSNVKNNANANNNNQINNNINNLIINEISLNFKNQLSNDNKENTLTIDDLLKDLDKNFYSIIDLDENNETANSDQIQENKILKSVYEATIEGIKQEKKIIDNFRKIQDNLYNLSKRKRKKEDEELLSSSQKKIKDLESLFKEIANQRKKDNENKLK